MDVKKAIPIGIESYKEIIDNDYYYIDKTLLIRDLLIQKSKVTLFTRPRRFGKTLAQSMLCTFFEEEIATDGTTVDNSDYFSGKKIMDAGEQYTGHLGKYPVIFLSMKSAKQPDFETAYESLVDEIIKEYDRHRYLLDGNNLAEDIKERYSAILTGKAGKAAYAKSLAFLSSCLEKYHCRKTIILVDEYDVPLENAYFRGFYDRMVDFIRSLLESALKTSDSLQFAVITGCLRISKESIFTGLNNLDVVSILDQNYAEYFGFVQSEVDSILSFYDIGYTRDDVKNWYDGYLFGNTEVYNPWSIINYVKDMVYHNTKFPKPYWSNTSSNNIVQKMVAGADGNTAQEIESLLAGDMIEKQIHEDMTYGDIQNSKDSLWNFLFFTGYLKAVGRSFQSDTIYIKMKIPNREVRYIYNNTIQEWIRQKTDAMDFTGLYNAILTGDTNTMEGFLKKQLRESISFMDSAEKFTEMEKLCKEALWQIDERHYDGELMEEGYPLILKYGICFCKKSCMVKMTENKLLD